MLLLYYAGHTILYPTVIDILYHTILYYTLLYSTILYHTIRAPRGLLRAPGARRLQSLETQTVAGVDLTDVQQAPSWRASGS